MNHSRSYQKVIRRWYRSLEQECPECHRRLREAMTLTRRIVIRLDGVIKLNHAGYRCPDVDCPGHQRTYRNPVADSLALPYFTFGLDIVLLVGQLHLGKHQTVDEIHQELLERLAPLGVTIARREILYLFEAYCTLLRASSEAKDDVEWLAQVKKNGGIIVSVDGIQPEKGNETVYVVRDALTGRVLSAENVTSSETTVMRNPARAGGGVGSERAGHDYRRARKRTVGSPGVVAGGAAPGVSVPCAARCSQVRLRGR
jgi:hypothetical protein